MPTIFLNYLVTFPGLSETNRSISITETKEQLHFPISPEQAEKQQKLKDLAASKPREIKHLSMWLLKQGWLDLLGETCPLSYKVIENFTSREWLRDFFDSFYAPAFQHLHPKASSAKCAAFIFADRPELLREDLVLSFLAGARQHLAPPDFAAVWTTMRSLWKEGTLPVTPNDPSLCEDIVARPQLCERRLYYKFFIDPKEFLSNIGIIDKEILKNFFFNIINRHGTNAIKEFLLRGGNAFAFFRGIQVVDYVEKVPLNEALKTHFRQHPECFRQFLHTYRQHLHKPYGKGIKEWKEYYSQWARYLRTLGEHLQFTELAPIVLELWSRDLDYDFLKVVHQRDIPRVLRHLLEVACKASPQEVTKHLSTLSTLSVDAIVYLASTQRPIRLWLHACYMQSFFPRTIVEQIFTEILPKYRHPMFDSPEFPNDLIRAYSQTYESEEKLASFMNALQNGHALQDIERALETRVFNKHPQKDEFFHLPADLQIAQLTSYYIHRDRTGLSICKSILKQPSSPQHVTLALKVLGAIPTHWSKNVLERVLKWLQQDPEEVALAAISAIASCPVEDHAPSLKEALFTKIQNPKSSPRVRKNALQALGSFSFNPQNPADIQMVRGLIERAPNEPQEVRVAMAKLLVQIPDRAALDTASHIVHSSDWDEFDRHYLKDRCVYFGSCFDNEHRVFIGIPDFMQSRSAMCTKLAAQYAQLVPKQVRLDAQVVANSYATGVPREELLQCMQRLEFTMKELQEVEAFNDSQDIKPDEEVRYAPMQLVYPLDALLFRGINNRKGDELFSKALIDLLSHGCVAADLNHLGKSYTIGTWLKQGIAFLSHDVDEVISVYAVDEEDTVLQGALIQVDPQYVNRQLRQDKARWENELSINTALCSGIPRHAIKAIFLPKAYEHDIQCIARGDTLQTLSTDIFKACDSQTIARLRKRLNDQMPDGIPFKEKIQFIEYTEKNLKAKFSSKTDASTDINDLMRVNFILQHYVLRPSFHAPNHPFVAMTQQIARHTSSLQSQKMEISSRREMVELISQHDIEPSCFSQGLQYLPFPFQILRRFSAGHGTKADKTPVNLLEHTLEVIFGRHRGFGLNQDLILDTLYQSHSQKILRIAALFHDVGKIRTLSAIHKSYSVTFALENLTQYKKYWAVDDKDIRVITTLIAYNDIFGNYFQQEGLSNLEELAAALHYAYDQVQHTVSSENDFFLLLFTLWIADASTLKVVNETHRDIYWNLFQKINSLTLDDIKKAKEAISKAD